MSRLHRKTALITGAAVDAFSAKYEDPPLAGKKRLVGKTVRFGCMGTAGDPVDMAAFPASSETDCIVARTYDVDGGNLMS